MQSHKECRLKTALSRKANRSTFHRGSSGSVTGWRLKLNRLGALGAPQADFSALSFGEMRCLRRENPINSHWRGEVDIIPGNNSSLLSHFVSKHLHVIH